MLRSVFSAAVTWSLLSLFPPTPTVLVPQFPRVAPDNGDVEVFQFKVRSSVKNTDMTPIQSLQLVSDPNQWKVSIDDRGNTLYAYNQHDVVFESKGKILATFHVYPHYQQGYIKIHLKTAIEAEISCYGGGPALPKIDHATVMVSNRMFATSAGFFKQLGLSFFIIHNGTELEGDNLFGSTLPIYWTKLDPMNFEFYIGSVNADFYLSYAASAEPANTDFLKFFWGITGKPKVPPPMYALGFMASRWGWEDRAYISRVLDQFDDHDVPIDAFIVDFEWYLNFSGGDYRIPASGLAMYPDFRFGNFKTFPDVRSQSTEYHARNVKFGGIRKPRLGDTQLLNYARSQGWTFRHLDETRNLNFAIPELKKWYADRTREMLAGHQNLPDFFWNDEGETSYFTYHHWIEAQQMVELAPDAANKRRFSLVRSFTPGLQRLESAAVWTGDVATTWISLKENVDMLCRWSEAGAPLVTFDIGGFAGPQTPGYEELLVRWYQLGAFAPVMRIHSTLENVPHFPFVDLWGKTHAKAMRDAIHFRYSMIPTLIAAFYDMKRNSIPWIERTGSHVETVKQFLCAGRKLFVVPILQPNGTVAFSLPSDSLWYTLNSRSSIMPPSPFELRDVGIGEMLVYAREGSMLLLHGADVSMATRATEMVGAGSILLIKIFFAGTDPNAIFGATLYEDDGSTLSGDVRETIFSFKQATHTLSWGSNPSNAPRWYSKAKVVLRFPNGQEIEAMISLTTATNTAEHQFFVDKQKLHSDVE